ncbi:Cytochrome c2 [Saccharicrinis carchari]|uniref:Cytochrome c2 n=1 Tax=Saccharicrinis carchari TaxID=1168039 RepID=A0A521C5V5_SACCC|nr:cytochrome c [Saccharicrinis carchari]SMO54802.1 Cytochrome c2 [Saccharicrinis carchari]
MIKSSLSLTVFLLLAFIVSVLQAQNSGEEHYKATCAACHTIGKGRLVGPDLSGVYERRDTDWLIPFIRSSQKMVKDGDPIAVALHNEYNKVPMPDNNLNDAQIMNIIDYIRQVDSGEARELAGGDQATDSTKQIVTTASDTALISYSNELIKKGEALFLGHEKFTNGASACIACHSVRYEAILGGGKLSLNLTESYTRLGPAGIKAILSNPPYPVMNVALRHNKLSDDEIESLVAMLYEIDKRYGQSPVKSSSGLMFSIFGFVLAMIFLVHIYLLYDNRQVPSYPK